MEKRKSGPPEPIESILERVSTSLGLGMKVKQYQIWEVWDSVVGEAIARQARPQQVRNMILWIAVSSSTWMQQLEFMKKQIVNRLNEHIGEVVIKDIRFRIGEIKESD
jgi:predicted nucleic acid-binding Zn ribbon protein